MDQEREGLELDVFLRLLREAAGQIVHLQHGAPFLSWMRVEAPRRFPEVFQGLPGRVRRALATELGRQVWNATPIPRRGFRPMPIPPRPGLDAPPVPGLNPELMWALVVAELPLEAAAALAEEGAIPRPYLGIVARRLVEAGRPGRAQSLLEPLFEDPEAFGQGDMDTLDALAGAYESLGMHEKLRSFVERFASKFLEAEP